MAEEQEKSPLEMIEALATDMQVAGPNDVPAIVQRLTEIVGRACEEVEYLTLHAERTDAVLGLPDLDDEPEDASWEPRFVGPPGLDPSEFILYLQSVRALSQGVMEATRKPRAELVKLATGVKEQTAVMLGVVELPVVQGDTAKPIAEATEGTDG